MKNHQTAESRERKAPWGPRPFTGSSVESRAANAGSIVNQKSKIVNELAFTLIELLVVIAIIAILAAMLLPVLSAAKVHAQKTRARLQANELVTAIQKFNSDYSRMPMSAAAQRAAVANGGSFTYGGIFQTPAAGVTWPNPVPANYYPSNNEVIAILMDLTNYPGTTVATINTNHQSNPQETQYLNPTQVSSTNMPGVGPDLNYRDPWGNPYVITMDVNDDNQCRDAFYSLQSVSQYPPLPAAYSQNGYNGLFNPNATAGPPTELNDYLYHGNVMVWSAGPNGQVDTTPGVGAKGGVNNDNIISWQ